MAEPSLLHHFLAQRFTLRLHCCLISAAGDAAVWHAGFSAATWQEAWLNIYIMACRRMTRTSKKKKNCHTVRDGYESCLSPRGASYTSYMDHVLLWRLNSPVTSLVILAPPVLFLLRLHCQKRGLLLLEPSGLKWFIIVGPPLQYSQSRMSENTCGFVFIWASAAGQRSPLFFCCRANTS